MVVSCREMLGETIGEISMNALRDSGRFGGSRALISFTIFYEQMKEIYVPFVDVDTLHVKLTTDFEELVIVGDAGSRRVTRHLRDCWRVSMNVLEGLGCYDGSLAVR